MSLHRQTSVLLRIQNTQDPLIQSFVIVPVLHPPKKSNSPTITQPFSDLV